MQPDAAEILFVNTRLDPKELVVELLNLRLDFLVGMC